MSDTATPRYGREMLAHGAETMLETIKVVMKAETDSIVLHRLAEVASECEWVVKTCNTIKEDKTNG